MTAYNHKWGLNSKGLNAMEYLPKIPKDKVIHRCNYERVKKIVLGELFDLEEVLD